MTKEDLSRVVKGEMGNDGIEEMGEKEVGAS